MNTNTGCFFQYHRIVKKTASPYFIFKICTQQENMYNIGGVDYIIFFTQIRYFFGDWQGFRPQ